MSISCETAGSPSTMIFPEICLCSKDVHELVEHQGHVQWIEWRADLLGMEPCEKIPCQKILWTYRSQEGTPLDQDQIKALIRALHSVALVDMQLFRDEALIRSLRHCLQRKVVVSYHGRYEGIEALRLKLNQMRFFPRVRYWKLALDFSDYNFKQVLEALQFIKSLPESWQNKIVFIPMGVKWTALRLWASCCFGALLFSCYHERGALAQGQPTLEAALAFQREFREGDFYALLGSSVNQSPSHISHNLAFHKLCEKARYLKLALEQEELEVFLKAASCLGIRGCSVTLPYKELAFENAATASSLASEVRAANLLCLTESGWYADNTDARAFIDLFELLKVDFNSHVLVLGSGGSAKAALVALVKKRACIDIVSRQLERALKAREDILPWIEAADPDQVQCHSFQNSPVWIHKKYDIIIQSTPLGMRAFDQYPFAFEDLHSQATLIELVNGPSLDKLETGYFHPTALSSYWQSKGRCVIEAKGFFTRQASYQFEAWIGCDKRLGYELLEAYFNPY